MTHLSDDPPPADPLDLIVDTLSRIDTGVQNLAAQTTKQTPVDYRGPVNQLSDQVASLKGAVEGLHKSVEGLPEPLSRDQLEDILERARASVNEVTLSAKSALCELGIRRRLYRAAFVMLLPVMGWILGATGLPPIIDPLAIPSLAAPSITSDTCVPLGGYFAEGEDGTRYCAKKLED